MLRSILSRIYPNIDVRVTVPFLLVVLVTAFIAIFVITRLTADTIQERLNNQLVDSAQVAEDSITNIESDYLATLRLMTFTVGVDTAITNADVAQLETLLRGLAANANVDDVIVVDAQATPLLRISGASFPPLGSQADISLPPTLDWSAVTRVLQGETDEQGDKFSEIILYDDVTVIYFVAPVRDIEGNIVGGILAGISENTLIRVLRNQALSEIAVYIDGVGLVASTLQAQEQVPTLDVLTQRNLLGNVAATSPIAEFTIEDTPYQFLFSDWELRSETIGVLAVALPTDFITNRLNTSRNTFILLFAVLVIVIASVGFLISQTIIRPVFHMVETTRAIRTGDLSRRMQLSTPDELGELGASFDHMTDKLVQSNVEISSLYQQQLQETAQRTAMLESIRDFVIVLDTSKTIILMNTSAQQLYNQLTQQPDNDQLKAFWTICRNPENYYDPVTTQLSDYDLSILATQITMRDESVLGHVLVLRDITSILEAERIKDRLIEQLSHELRTPLTATRGYVELAKMMTGDARESYISKSLDQMDLLGNMINRVVDVSVILSGRLELDMTSVNLNSILSDSIEAHRDDIEQAQLSLRANIEQPQVTLQADEGRLRKAFDHIIQNSINYTLPEGQIEISLRLKNNLIEVEIADSGVGVAPDEQNKIFDRMYRGRAADAGETDKRGLGLGLFITKEIVEAHHGQIALASALNVGTTIYIRLPLEITGDIQRASTIDLS